MGRVASLGWGRRISCVCLALLLSGVWAVAGTNGRADAAGPLPAPTNLSPSGGNAGPNPLLTWNAVSGAQYYKVTHPDRNGNARTDTVYATSFATTEDYPVGNVNWSVTAYDDQNDPGTAANASFNNQAANGPTLTCPTSPVNFPVESPAFSWTPVPGIKTYTLQVSTTSTFVPASTDTYQTQATSYTLTEGVPVNQDYYAKVSGTSYNGINTPASATCSYKVVWSPGATGNNDAKPTLESPVDHATIRDVILRWEPLKGAASYEVQVSPNGDWTNNLYYDIVTDSTTWSPAKTLNNGSYYWRVRGIDNAGNFSQWSDYPSTSAGDAWEFNVAALASPEPVYPVAESTIANPDLRFSWKPVPGAAAYELQWSSNSSFSYANQGDEINHTCITTHTDWSPYLYVNPPGTFRGPGNDACRANRRDQSPGFLDGTTVYWHVRALDNYTQPETASPWNTNDFDTTNHRPPTNKAFVSQWSSPRRFFFNSATPTVTGPANGATVATPMMTWTRVSGAQYYIVNYSTNAWTWDNDAKKCVAPTGAAHARTSKTSALSYTPDLVPYPRKPDSDRDPDPYWDQCPINVSFSVQSVDYSDRTSPLPAARSFKWSGYSLTGTSGSITLGSSGTDPLSGQAINPANGASIQGVPRFTWTPVVGADHYQVWWFDNPSGSVYTPMQDYNFGGNQTDPLTESFTPTQVMRAETGAWQVVALSSGNSVIASSPKRTLTVDPPDPTSSISFATRDGAGGPVPCGAGTAQSCLSTPLITWDTDPEVDSYKVFIALDPSFTNIKRVYQTEQNSIRPVEALPDNQAGQSYYVAVQPVVNNWRTGGINVNGTIYGDYGAAINPANVSSFHKQSAPVTSAKVIETGSTVTAGSTSVCDDGTGVSTFSDVPTFCWNASSTMPYASGDLGAMSYHIQVSTTPDYSNIIDQAWVDQPSYTPYAWPMRDNGGYGPESVGAPTYRPIHKTYPDGPLYWRVQAVDGTGNGLTYSTSESVTKDSNAVSLNSPANGATVGSTPSLRWSSKYFAARYQVQVARNGDTNFSNPNVAFNRYTDLTSLTPSNNNNTVNGTALPAGTYAWRVRGVDADDHSGAWSSVRTFTVDPAAPSLTSPADNASFTALAPLTFKWNTVEGAVRYRFYLSQSNPPTSGGVRIDTVSNAWSLDRNLANGSWYWQVDALDAQNQVLSSSAVNKYVFDGSRPGVTGQKASVVESGVSLRWDTAPVQAVGAVTSFTITATDTTNSSGNRTVTVHPNDSAAPPATGGNGGSTLCTNPATTTATMHCAYVLIGLRNGDNYTISITPNDANGPGTTTNINTRPYRYSPFGNDDQCVAWLYQNLLNTNPSSGQKNVWTNWMSSGNRGCSKVAYNFWRNSTFQSMFAVNRLYHAYFLRSADYSGLRFWMKRRSTPGTYWTLNNISSYFAGSGEFDRMYGSKTNGQFVNLVYQNVLGRAPDADGYAYYVNRLNNHSYTRGRVMTAFSESNEFKNQEMVTIKAEMLVLMMYHRSPTAAEMAYYEAMMPSNNPLASDVQTALTRIMQTQEFADLNKSNPLN